LSESALIAPSKDDSCDYLKKLLGEVHTNSKPTHPVFGVPLKDLPYSEQSPIHVSNVLREILSYLCSSEALQRSDIFDSATFRANRSKENVKYLRKLFDEGQEVDLGTQKPQQPEVFALLLEFLCSIPEPLIPQFYETFMVIEIMGQRYNSRKKLEELARKEIKEHKEKEKSDQNPEGLEEPLTPESKDELEKKSRKNCLTIYSDLIKKRHHLN